MNYVQFLKDVWMEFRLGFYNYISLPISVVSSMLIIYRLLVEGNPFLHSLFPDLIFFMAISIFSCIPIATGFGYFHRTRQMGTDQNITLEKSTVFMDVVERLKRIEKKIDAEAKI